MVTSNCNITNGAIEAKTNPESNIVKVLLFLINNLYKDRSSTSAPFATLEEFIDSHLQPI